MNFTLTATAARRPDDRRSADPTAALVARLESGGFDPKATGPDSWESKCPAHKGDRRNLTVSRGDDGRVLMHCHAHQCPPAEIMGALGMTEADLFPPRDNGYAKPTADAAPVEELDARPPAEARDEPETPITVPTWPEPPEAAASDGPAGSAGMSIDPRSAYVLGTALTGRPLNGELETIPEGFRRLARHLVSLPLNDRRGALEGFLADRPDKDSLIMAVFDADLEGPVPDAVETSFKSATLADLRNIVSNQAWLWQGYLPAGVMTALASDPGTGKTVLAMDLARRLWHKLPWPDGQENNLPTQSRTLWIPGDRHYAQLLELASGFGIPDEALLFNAPPDDPTSGLDLDDPAELDALERRIEADRPVIVVVDTVGMTTSRNLCRPEDARAYFGPLMDLASRSGVALLCLTHLNKSAEALGRRIVGAARVVWKLTCPDPEGRPNRRRLWVDKSYCVKPPALGMGITDKGCEFDLNPPSAPENESGPARGGRPAASRDKAETFIREKLQESNDRKATSLCGEWEDAGNSPSPFWRARDAMEKAGELTCEGKPKVMHLNARHEGETENDDDLPDF